MKIYPLLISWSISICLIFGGAYLAIRATDNTPLLAQGPRHPVTATMAELSAKMALKDAPNFTGTTTEGEKVSLLSLTEDKPLFILFIRDGCPCSVEAQPLFNDLAAHFKGQVQFLGVIDKPSGEAKTWVKANKAAFPVIADETCKTMAQFGATNSVYSVLISRDGKIQKMWPGYSEAIMKEQNSKLAREIDAKESPFDTKYAPKEPTSGCPFKTSNQSQGG